MFAADLLASGEDVKLPPALVAVFGNAQYLRQHSETLHAVVEKYNAILTTMLPEECSVLQRPHRDVEMVITKCLSSKLTKVPMNWRSHGTSAFLKRMHSAVRSLASGMQALHDNSELIRSIATKWREFPLFDRKAPNSPLHESLDLNAEETKLRVDSALNALRESLGDGLTVIAEKLKVSANKVGVNTTSTQWQQYARYCDQAVQTGIRAAYAKTLSDLRHTLTGGQHEEGPQATPVMEIKLELTAGIVHFTPLAFGTSTGANIRGIVRAWAAATSDVYNGAFQSAAVGTSVDALGASSDVARLLIAIEQAETECADQRAEFLKQFIQLSCLWEDNMSAEFETFMRDSGEQSRRTAASCDRDYFPSLHQFEEQINRFRAMGNTVVSLPSFATVKYIRVDARPIKQAMTSWATKWSSMFETFLADSVHAQLKATREFVQEIEVELDVTVENDEDDDSLKIIVLAMLRVENSASTIGAVFRPVQDALQMLEGLGVPLGDQVVSLALKTETRWNRILHKCECAKSKYERHIQAVSRRVAQKTTKLTDAMKDWRRRFHKAAPVQFTLAPVSKSESVAKDQDDRSCAALHVGLAMYDHRAKQYRNAYADLRELSKAIHDFELQVNNLKQETAMFQLPPPRTEVLHTCRRDLLRLKKVWDAVSMVTMTLDHWSCVPWADRRECRVDHMLDITKSLLSAVGEAPLDQWPGFSSVVVWVNNFRAALQAVAPIHKSTTVRVRHWRSLAKQVVNSGVSPATDMVQYCEHDDVALKLGDVLSLQPHPLWCAEAFDDMLSKAEGEFELDLKLSVLARHYEELELAFDRADSDADPMGTPPTVTQMYRVQEMELIFTKLSEHQTDVSAMQFSKHLEFFRATVGLWSQRLRAMTMQLTLITELGASIEAMSQWYFVEARVRLDLEEDTRTFELLFFRWQRLLRELEQEPNVLVACSPSERLDSLEQMKGTAERCKMALERWVECVRSSFPRLYFLSRAELLSATVRSVPTACLAYLPKLFAGLRHLEFNRHETEVIGVSTSGGCTLSLEHSLSCTSSQDDWLPVLLHEVQQTLRNLSREALLSGVESQMALPQIAILNDCITFTRVAEAAMQSLANGNSAALDDLARQQSDGANILILHLRNQIGTGKSSNVDSIRMRLLCRLRHRDIIGTLTDVSGNDTQKADWLWQSQLRYYNSAKPDGRPTNGEFTVKILRSAFEYTFELLPTSMFHQPLTDRSFATMAMAIDSVHGVSLCGPTGSGKTQTVVSLGHSIGRMVYTLNCHSTMHPDTMACIFKGIAQAGVWCCFDYGSVAQSIANTVVVVAQHLNCLLSGIRGALETVDIGGDAIPLSNHGAFLMTRTDQGLRHVPIAEDLRSWLRPAGVNSVDHRILCEYLMTAAGCQHYQVVGPQLSLLFELCADCLCESAYDWSTRALCKVIGACELKSGDVAFEQQQVARAFMAAVWPRLHSDDRPLLRGLLRDTLGYDDAANVNDLGLLKSNVESDGNTITQGIQRFCELAQIQPSTDLPAKACQLESLLQRSAAVILVGDAGCGKSTLWKALATANSVNFEVVSPSSITEDLTQHVYPSASGTRREGPLTKILRRMVTTARLDKQQKWVVLDGSVDLTWIEALHEISDDSNHLYLPSSNDTVLLEGAVRLLFECDSLASASPATISRVSVLSLHVNEPSWRLAATSWLANVQSVVAQTNLRQMFGDYLGCLVAKTEQQHQEDGAAALRAVSTACSLLTALLLNPSLELAEGVGTKMTMPVFSPSAVAPSSDRSDVERVEAVFNFVAVWSFGGSIVSPSERREFDIWWRSTWQGMAMPSTGSVFDFYMDSQGNFVPWSSFVPRLPRGIVDVRSYCIPNVDTTRIFALYELLLLQQHPVMLVGDHGAGKTCIVRHLSSTFEHRDFVYTPCNRATTSSRLMDAFLERLSSQNGILCPIYSNETEIVFIVDDLTAPQPDAHHGQSVAALLRHLIECSQVMLDGENTPIRGAQYIASSGSDLAPGARGSSRLTRHFATFAVTPLREAELVSLFEPMVTRRFSSAGARRTASSVVHATVALHSEMGNLIPALAGSCITSVFHGICRVQDFSTRSLVLVQLWLQECQRTYRDRLQSSEDVKAYDTALTQICKRCLDSNLNLQRARQQILLVPAIHETAHAGVCPLSETAADDVRKLVTGLVSSAEQDLDRLVDHSDSLVMEALEHICRAARSLSVSSGHVIVTGDRGSGKYTSAVLGARLCGYSRIMDLTGAASQGEDSFKLQLKRACMAAGIGPAAGYVCLLTGTLPEYAMGLIDSTIATGSVDGSFDETETEKILAAMQTELSQQGLVVGPKECWAHFRTKTQQKLHFIILCNRPAEAMCCFPALWRSCGINYVPTWSTESLYEMAIDMIASGTLNLNSVHEEAVAQSFVRGHLASLEACKTLFATHGRHIPIAPNTLRDCIQLCENLVVRRRKRLGETSQQTHVALQNLTRLEKTVVVGMRAKLVAAKANEKAKVAAVDEIIEKVGAESERLAEQVKILQEYTRVVDPLVSVVSKAKATVEATRAQLTAAESAVKSSASELKKMHLAELSAPARQKPEIVQVVASVVVLMRTSGDRPDVSWKHLRTVISDGDFRASFAKFNAQSVTDESLVAAQKYLEEPTFSCDYLRTKCKSKPAANLCSWSQAVVDHCLTSRRLVLEMELLAKAEQMVASGVAKRNSQEAHVAAIAERVDILKKEFDFVSREKVTAAELVQNIGDRISVAEQVARCVSEPVKHWKESADAVESSPSETADADAERARFDRFDSDNTGELEKAEVHAMMTEMGIDCDPDYLNAVLAKFDLDGDGSVGFEEFKKMWALIEAESTSTGAPPPEVLDVTVGDAMVAAVHMTYLAAFGPRELRVEVRSRWLAELDHRGVLYSKDQDWMAVLEPAVRPLDWVYHGLPGDTCTIENAAVALRSARFPLIVDPEGQAEEWLAETYKTVGLRVAHCKDTDIASQVARWDSTPLVVQMDHQMSARECSELFQGLRLHAEHAAERWSEATSHTRVFLHYRVNNPLVPAAIAPLCTLIWFGSGAASIKERVLGTVVSMTLNDNGTIVSISDNPALKVTDAQTVEQDALHALLQVVLKIEPDNERVFTLDNAAIVAVSTAAEEWHKAAEACRATTDDVHAAEAIRAEYEPLAQQLTKIHSCCQQMGGALARTAGDATVFAQAVCKAISDCWKEREHVLAADIVKSSVESILLWVKSEARPLDQQLIFGLICIQETARLPGDSADLLLSPQLQPEAFTDALRTLISNHLGQKTAAEVELTNAGSGAEAGVLRLSTDFRDNLQRALSLCASRLISADPALEEAMLRCCWLHSVLVTRMDDGKGAFSDEILDAVVDAARDYANGASCDVIRVTCLMYTASLSSQWDRRICEAYVYEIMATRDHGGDNHDGTGDRPQIMLPNLPLSLVARSELRVALESGGSVAESYVKVITAARAIDSFEGISQLLGLTAGDAISPLMASTKYDVLDRWWRINDISPPRVDIVEHRATAKSTLDDLLDELPPPASHIDPSKWIYEEHDPMWPVAEAVRRETTRYTRIRSCAEATLKELDRALEAAERPGPTMQPRLQALADALASYTVPESWFHDVASAAKDDGPAGRNRSRHLAVLPIVMADATDAETQQARSVHEWTGMMQACLSQITAWQAVMARSDARAGQVAATTSGRIVSDGDSNLLLQVSLREVFRPREFLAACRQTIARQRGWALGQTQWSAQLYSLGGPRGRDRQVSIGVGSGTEDGCVTLVGLHLHGANWSESEGLQQMDGGGSEPSATSAIEMPPVRLTLVQQGYAQTPESQTPSASYYECPVFQQGMEQQCIFTIKLQADRSVPAMTGGVYLAC